MSQKQFLSTPSARRATTAGEAMPLHLQISIHALREEGDIYDVRNPLKLRQFLSTPSARRATGVCRTPTRGCEISIHALREEGDERAEQEHYPLHISIHALREEGDRRCRYVYPRRPILSTPSARRATRGDLIERQVFEISIHALREEGDPTPPPGAANRLISIHALREEGDAVPCMVFFVPLIFLSTPSARRATVRQAFARRSIGFLSTPSARRATRYSLSLSATWSISIHALREEGDRGLYSMQSPRRYFYPRPPRGGRPSSL